MYSTITIPIGLNHLKKILGLASRTNTNTIIIYVDDVIVVNYSREKPKRVTITKNPPRALLRELTTGSDHLLIVYKRNGRIETRLVRREELALFLSTYSSTDQAIKDLITS